MKDKILAKLLTSISAGAIEETINFENDVIADLLVPLMELFSVESVSELKDKLNAMLTDINEDFIDTVAVSLEKTIDPTDDIEKDNGVIDTFVNNCKAISFTLSSQDEDAMASLNTKVIEYINDEAKKADDEDDENKDKGEENTEAAGITIVPGTDEVSETAWGDVNKTELKNMLKAALDNETPGAEEAIQETFGLVGSMEKTGDWKWPHHEFMDDKVVLNVNGLKAAALFLMRPNSSKNLTTTERSDIAKHLLKHYKEIDTEAPEKLANLSEGKESVIVINVKNDELKDFSEAFNVDIEDVGTYVGLAEALLTDLLNSGIISIEGSEDESVLSLKLTKEQLEALIAQFDIMSDDIISILDGKLDSLSYKKSEATISADLTESTEKINKLMKVNDELNEKLTRAEGVVTKLSNVADINKMYDRKFEAIENFIKSIEGVDDSMVNFVSSVIDAENPDQINYLIKLSGSFLPSRNESAPKFIKKINMIDKDQNIDVDQLINLIGEKTSHQDNKTTEIDKKVNELSNYI